MSFILGGILAGGKNSRMDGYPKGRLKVNGETFLDIIYDRLSDVTSTVYVSVHDKPKQDPPGDAKYIKDRFRNIRSSMNGVYSLLSRRKNNILVIPWDMPLITRNILEYLVGQWNKTHCDFEGVFYNVNDALQPFPGIYSTKLLGGLRTRLKEGKYSLRKLLLNRRTKLISTNELNNQKNVRSIFQNINTPQDYAQFLIEQSARPV